MKGTKRIFIMLLSYNRDSTWPSDLFKEKKTKKFIWSYFYSSSYHTRIYMYMKKCLRLSKEKLLNDIIKSISLYLSSKFKITDIVKRIHFELYNTQATRYSFDRDFKEFHWSLPKETSNTQMNWMMQYMWKRRI